LNFSQIHKKQNTPDDRGVLLHLKYKIKPQILKPEQSGKITIQYSSAQIKFGK